MDIKIGDEFFIFDINRRVYERDEKGHAKGGPTFRGHFVSVKITGETSRSWITNHWDMKVPKKDPFSVLYTENMIDEAEWISEHRYRISEAVRRIEKGDILKQIAELIGYEV